MVGKTPVAHSTWAALTNRTVVTRGSGLGRQAVPLLTSGGCGVLDLNVWSPGLGGQAPRGSGALAPGPALPFGSWRWCPCRPPQSQAGQCSSSAGGKGGPHCGEGGTPTDLIALTPGRRGRWGCWRRVLGLLWAVPTGAQGRVQGRLCKASELNTLTGRGPACP